MPYWRSQPVSPAGLSPHASAAWSHRPMPQFSERSSSIPPLSRFGGGCRGQGGTPDEVNDQTVTAEGMASDDLAARRPYRVCAWDGFRVCGWGDRLPRSDSAVLCRDPRNLRPLPGDGRGLVASPSTGWEARMTVCQYGQLEQQWRRCPHRSFAHALGPHWCRMGPRASYKDRLDPGFSARSPGKSEARPCPRCGFSGFCSAAAPVRSYE